MTRGVMPDSMFHLNNCRSLHYSSTCDLFLDTCKYGCFSMSQYHSYIILFYK